MLAESVEVAGDGTGTDVRALADRGVADIGEVRHLAALADFGGLDLDEGARLGTAVQHRPRAQRGEWSHLDRLTHRGAADHRVADP